MGSLRAAADSTELPGEPVNALPLPPSSPMLKQILTYELWSSDEVINANIVVLLSLLFVAPYIVYY